MPNESPRAAALVRDALESRVCIVQASAGWGKTTAARAAVAGRAHLWIDLGSAPGEPAALLAEISRTLHWPQAGESEDAGAFARRIPPGTGTIAIDDAQRIRGDERSIELVRAIVERRADLRLLLIGREDLPLPIATWAANGIAALPVTEADLAIGRDELHATLVEAGLRADEAAVSAILRFTQGWAVAIRFAAMALRRSPDLVRAETVGRDLAFKYLAEQILLDLDEVQRELLEHLAMAGPFDDDLLEHLASRDAAEWVLHAGLPLHRSPGVVRLHDVFAGFLIAQMGDETRSRRARRVAGDLLARGRTGDALDVLRFHAPEAVCAFLEGHGVALLQSGRRSSVRAAIAGLPIRERRDEPSILMLRAWLEHGSGNFSRAQALSDRALARSDRESPAFLELVRLGAILKLSEQREEAFAWMERAMATSPERVRNELRGPYAIYLALDGEVDAAVDTIEALVAEAERADSAPLLARAYTWAMTVYAHAGDHDRVAAYGVKARAIHERAQDLKGLTIVENTLALSSYVLRDDRADTLRHARAYLDAAQAWGDPLSVKQSTAFLFQLAVERGDEAEASRHEATLGTTDVSFGGILWYRTTLAIRRAATGDFNGAAALLDGIEAHVTDPLERRCRHAIAATFLALAGERERAAAHADAALAAKVPARNAVAERLDRIALIYCGFAEVFLGRPSASRKLFARALRKDEAALAQAGLELAAVAGAFSERSAEPVAAQLEGSGQHGFASLVRAAARANAPSPERYALTQTEVRVLRDVASGLTPKQIAGASGRSVETVRNQLKAAIRKLGASGRLQAIALARNAGLV